MPQTTRKGSQPVEYPISGLAKIFPAMPKEDYDRLVASIKENGLIEPISVWRGEVLDGRHRYQACVDAGVAPEFSVLNDDIDPVKFIIAKNDDRRNLDSSQRAIVAFRLSEWSKVGGRRVAPPEVGRKAEEAPQTNGTQPIGDGLLNQEAAASLMGVSADSIGRAGKVLRASSNAHQDLREALESGVVKVTDAAQIVDKAQEVQQEALAKVKNREARNLTSAVNAIGRRRMAENPPPLPAAIYRTIVVDPPWPMVKISREARPNQEGFDYPTMSIEEIAEMDISSRLADDGLVFLWSTQKFLPESFRILEQWGVKYRFTMVWHKPGGIQIHGYPQFNAEFIVVGAKGNPMFLDLKGFDVAFHAPRREHSVKPEEFYTLLRRVTAGPRLDMFSRRAIEGFDAWGNEA